MINYLIAEIRRIFSKKSLYILTGIFVVFYTSLIILKTDGAVTPGALLSDTSDLAMMLTVFAGTFVFAAIYTDDLNARSLSQVIGFGRKKATIVLAKLILIIFFTALICLVSVLLTYLVYGVILGFQFSPEVFKEIIAIMSKMFMMIVGYGALSSVLVYGVQKAVLAVVAFGVLATSLISILLGNILGLGFIVNAVGDLFQYTLYPISDTFMNEMSLANFWPFAIYVTVFTVLAILAFRKKELEF